MKRLQKMQSNLKRENLKAFLITSRTNVRYMSYFTGTSGMCLILQNDAYFITDFRYVEQASDEVIHMENVKHSGNPYESVLKILKRHGVNELAFEGEDITVLQYKQIKKTFKNIKLKATNNFLKKQRMIKDEEEIKLLKKAAKIADDAFIHIQSFIKQGVKEIDIALELEFFMRKQGATSSSFDIIVASGVRSSLPHGVASNKTIENGELVTLDYGAFYKGYCSDITRTFAVGEVDSKLKTIYETVLKAQEETVAKIKSGMTGKEADKIARSIIEEKGFGKYFGHATGHGLGMEVHEGPTLSPHSNDVLQPGMVVTVEPGIYIPNLGGCRIEDDIVITENGNERLTKSPKHFIQL